jgi:hypothetical protein
MLHKSIGCRPGREGVAVTTVGVIYRLPMQIDRQFTSGVFDPFGVVGRFDRACEGLTGM